MQTNFSALMKSQFFSPAFNSAIYDGPVRIYFAQFHESSALKLYFSLQERYAVELERAKTLGKQSQRQIYILLYPTPELFKECFECNEAVDRALLQTDSVIGVQGPPEKVDHEMVVAQIRQALNEWQGASRPEPHLSLVDASI